jgi:hypothetical protein
MMSGLIREDRDVAGGTVRPYTAAGRTGPISRAPVDVLEQLLGGCTMPTYPRIGDIVLYVYEGEQYPAIVVKVHDPDDLESALSLAYFTPEPCWNQTVAYSAAAEPGRWSWREPPST